MPSRRSLFGSAAAMSVACCAPRIARAASLQPQELLSLFDSLPGIQGIKIVAPATNSAPQLYIAQNASQQLFVGSAIKTFALAQALVKADGPDVVTTLQNQYLTLDESVWNDDSASFNPPNLSGTVSERTTLEAMIMHSDNTATDMMFKYLGPDTIRGFISSIGLKSTMVPDSTRIFSGYLLGAQDYKSFSWAELKVADANPNAQVVNSPLNGVETLASSADDFVSYYSRGLQGKFFKNDATLTEYQRILTLGDAIFLVGFPLGASAFCKGGSIDVPGFHALCVPGGLYFNNRWVYFCFTINWYAETTTDSDTTAAFIKAVNSALNLVYERLTS